MEIKKTYQVPTGQIHIVQGEKGLLEMLSLADYGKDVNLSKKPVVATKTLPLTEKHVVTVSTQYGCSSGCTFCDVPKVGPGVNATYADLCQQIKIGIGDVSYTKRLNVHFARMGEPTWNPYVIECAEWLYSLEGQNPYPVVSTMMPRKNRQIDTFLHDWMDLKNNLYDGNAGLQISINSTDEAERNEMFSGNAMSIRGIAETMWEIPDPVGRKITLNFAVAGYTVDAKYLSEIFNPDHFICKLTPMHKTASCGANNIVTDGDYTTPEPYLLLEKQLNDAGFETLVFIASKDEDEGRVTCGNAILSGTKPFDLKE